MEKVFSRFDFFFNIIPGSIILIFFTWYYCYPLSNMDIFGGFIFLLFAYFIGDFLQIICTLPWIRNIFGLFIFLNKHSWLFLLKNNPILKNRYIDGLKHQYKLFFHQTIDFDFNLQYKKRYFYGNTEIQKQTQYIFNQIYNVVRGSDMVKASNEKYLFTRSCVVAFLIISIFSFIMGQWIIGFTFIAASIIFLYRNHRIARGFIKQIVLHFNNSLEGK